MKIRIPIKKSRLLYFIDAFVMIIMMPFILTQIFIFLVIDAVRSIDIVYEEEEEKEKKYNEWLKKEK